MAKNTQQKYKKGQMVNGCKVKAAYKIAGDWEYKIENEDMLITEATLEKYTKEKQKNI